MKPWMQNWVSPRAPDEKIPAFEPTVKRSGDLECVPNAIIPAIAMVRDSAETACPAPVPIRTTKRGGVANRPNLRIVRAA